ncbi:unnamed protein product, partial [Polarella glacialis]
AALQFSKTQTKKHIFSGLKAITHQLAVVISAGRDVTLDFHIGKLMASNKQVSFAFAAQFYSGQGVRVPQQSKAVSDMHYQQPEIVKTALGLYTLDSLLEDVGRQLGRNHTGFTTTKPSIEYGEVWAAISRYCLHFLKEKRGVVLPNFLRVGWELPRDKLVNAGQHQPYFNISEAFAHAYGVRQLRVGKPPLPDSDLAPFEELNFAKAALKFSKNLQKDHFLTGYKLIVQQIGVAMAQGRSVSLEFTFGRLTASNFTTSFTFASQFLATTGIEKPVRAVDDIKCPARRWISCADLRFYEF